MRATALLLGLVLGLSTGCSSSAPPSTAPVGRTPPSGTSDVRPLAGPPGLVAERLVAVTNRDAPLVFARNGASAMFALVADGKLMARKLGAKDLVLLAEVPALAAGFSLRAFGDGFLLFWDERLDQNHVFKLQRFDAEGKPSAVVSLPPLAESNLGFSDVIVDGTQAMIVYEIVRGDRVSVVGQRLGDGATLPSSPATPIVEEALAWHAAQSIQGLVVASVESAGPVEPGRPILGNVAVRSMSWKGELSSKTVLTKAATAQIDVEVAALERGVVVAWTDEESEEGAVRVATVGSDGSVRGPSWVAPPIGEQALVSLTAEGTGHGARALVAWENVGQAVEGSRVVNLALVDPTGTVGKERTRLLLSGAERPDVVAEGDGFALLTLAPPKTSGEPDPATQSMLDGRPWPTMLRLGADLAVDWAEPVRFGGLEAVDGVPEFAWGLSCAAGRCTALAADGVDPTNFYVVESVDRETVWAAPAWRSDAERPPRVVALRTVTRGDRVASASAISLGAGSPAVGWVTYFQPGMPTAEAPRGEAPYAATIALRAGAGTGEETSTLSRRASSIGGIALTPSTHKKDEAVVAWVAEEKSGPQVYATRVDAKGKKLHQKKVTLVTRSNKGKGAPSLATHVAITGAPGAGRDGKETSEGYVVSWVDTRDGNGEVYVARLGKDLDKTVVDKRLTNAPGDAADVTVVAHGGSAFVAFADARDGAPADIYFTRLDATTLAKKDDVTRVYASSGPSRSPRLALAGDRLVLAWIEESGPEGRGSLRFAEIDPSGRLLDAAKVVEAPDGGSINGLALACTADQGCRVVLSWASKEGRLDMGGFQISLGDAATPSARRPQASSPGAGTSATWTVDPIVRLGSLSSGPFAEPSFSFADTSGTTLFFAEDLGDRGRVRQVELSWAR
jgi:hypothetical protein